VRAWLQKNMSAAVNYTDFERGIAPEVIAWDKLTLAGGTVAARRPKGWSPHRELEVRGER